MSRDSTDSQKKIEKLKTKAFWIAFEMVFIFGLPAAGAVLISQWRGWASEGLYAALAVAFVLSWVIVIFRVRALSAEMTAAREAKGADENNDETDS